MIIKNPEKIVQEFIDFLLQNKISQLSLKFYKSDLSHFMAWLKADELSSCLPYLTQDEAKEYKNYLVVNNIKPKTINRRLSTLRQLGRFLLLSQILPFNFSEGLTNIPLKTHKVEKINLLDLLDPFKNHLFEEKVAKNTIKNYMADVKHFLAWLEINN